MSGRTEGFNAYSIHIFTYRVNRREHDIRVFFGCVWAWLDAAASRIELTIVTYIGTIVPIMDTNRLVDPLARTFFSRNRRAVLGLLYGHPDEQFYLRQIVRLSGGGVGAIQRELGQLTSAGLLRRSSRGNQVIFQANLDCPIASEIKGIVLKTAGVADVLRAALAPLAERVSVGFMHGSMAEGKQRAQSDVDVTIIGDVTFGEIIAAFVGAADSIVPRNQSNGLFGRRVCF